MSKHSIADLNGLKTVLNSIQTNENVLAEIRLPLQAPVFFRSPVPLEASILFEKFLCFEESLFCKMLLIFEVQFQINSYQVAIKPAHALLKTLDHFSGENIQMMSKSFFVNQYFCTKSCVAEVCTPLLVMKTDTPVFLTKLSLNTNKIMLTGLFQYILQKVSFAGLLHYNEQIIMLKKHNIFVLAFQVLIKTFCIFAGTALALILCCSHQSRFRIDYSHKEV